LIHKFIKLHSDEYKLIRVAIYATVDIIVVSTYARLLYGFVTEAHDWNASL